MVNRKGVFIGAYVPNDLKETLRRRAAAEHRTLSQEITRILTEAVHGRTLPPGAIDRPNTAAVQPAPGGGAPPRTPARRACPPQPDRSAPAPPRHRPARTTRPRRRALQRGGRR